MIEIDLLDSTYYSNYHITKILSLLGYIYTGLIQRLIAIEKVVSEFPIKDWLAMAIFLSLIARFWQVLRSNIQYTNWLKKTDLNLSRCYLTSMLCSSTVVKTLLIRSLEYSSLFRKRALSY
jgi:hypothetical protein